MPGLDLLNSKLLLLLLEQMGHQVGGLQPMLHPCQIKLVISKIIIF